MVAYYNEVDPHAVQHLRNLIDAGHIAPGVVDTRSIEDVTPNDIKGFNQCHFFAGIGGWSLALRRAGWSDSRPAWTASCPCQPFSAAGKGLGFADERHLWPSAHWLVGQCRPVVVLASNLAALTRTTGSTLYKLTWKPRLCLRGGCVSVCERRCTASERPCLLGGRRRLPAMGGVRGISTDRG